MTNENYAEAYPLHWPDGWPRTLYPEGSSFKTRFSTARDNLVRELRLMGAQYVVVSTNVPLRGDGLPYANFKTPDDLGVAVYFQYETKSMTFACDRWNTVADNIQAIRKTIEALRGIERWGASDMMERAFSGFQALTSPESMEWWEVLSVSRSSSLGEIKKNYKDMVRIYHPDNGSAPDVEMMKRINRAISDAEREKAA